MKHIWKKVFIWLMVLTLLPVYSASAAGVGILSATDGTNDISTSAEQIPALTAPGAEIVIEGLASPAESEVTVQVRSASEPEDIKYVYQQKSDKQGMFSFRFSTEGYEPDTYAVAVNVAGAAQAKMRYFRIAPPQVPEGAHDVFDCFTVNGRPVSFDDSKYAFVEMTAQERDTVPVFDISTVDETAEVTLTPAVVPKIPCAVKVNVSFADGTEKVYSLVLDEEADKRISNLVVAEARASDYIIEDNIRLGDSTENASLVYSDRTNVYWRSASSPIFAGATQIKRAKSDAGGFTNDNTTVPNDPDKPNGSSAPKISSRPYYAGAYSGQNGEPYWMSFTVHADATVFMSDGHGQGWPNNDGTWKNDSYYTVAHGSGGASASGKSLYYKKFKAGDTVQIPNYGVPEGWPEGESRVYDPPAFVVVWDSNGTVEGTDASLTSLSYQLDGGARAQLSDFRPDLDHYTLVVGSGAEQITFDAVKSDEGASIAPEDLQPVSLDKSVTQHEIRVVSAGGIVEKTYTVTIKKDLSNLYYGDVNGDGEATSDDALWILRREVGLATPQGFNWLAADVNGDGEGTSDDALWILRYEVGLSLPDNIMIGIQ